MFAIIYWRRLFFFLFYSLFFFCCLKFFFFFISPNPRGLAGQIRMSHSSDHSTAFYLATSKQIKHLNSPTVRSNLSLDAMQEQGHRYRSRQRWKVRLTFISHVVKIKQLIVNLTTNHRWYRITIKIILKSIATLNKSWPRSKVKEGLNLLSLAFSTGHSLLSYQWYPF